LTIAGIAPLGVSTAYANDNMSNSDQPVTDSWITTKVKAELATTDGVKSTDISVKTVDGVVTLTGVLGTPLAVKKAVAAAESIKGVKKVDHDGLKSR
jgi:hyperosmotically inducible protein